jgi:hypothetical protein
MAVACTATDHCSITCNGSNLACQNSVFCQTNGDCKLVCGQNNNGNDCRDGAHCYAGTTCDVECNGNGTCLNGRVIAKAGTTATVNCADGQNCINGVAVSGAVANVTCGTGNSCQQDTYCDAGSCSDHCSNSGTRLCCTTGSSCSITNCSASIKTSGGQCN